MSTAPAATHELPLGEELLYVWTSHTLSDIGERLVGRGELEWMRWRWLDVLFLVTVYTGEKRDTWKWMAGCFSMETHAGFYYGVMEDTEEITLVYFLIYDVENVKEVDVERIVDDWGATELYMMTEDHRDCAAIQLYMRSMGDNGCVTHGCYCYGTEIGGR